MPYTFGHNDYLLLAAWKNLPLRKFWMVLPQGFRNSHTLFGNILAKELEQWLSERDATARLVQIPMRNVWKLQLACSVFCAWQAIEFGKGKLRGKVKVLYVSFTVMKGHRELSAARKEAICIIAVPTSKKQQRGFLGMAGQCQRRFSSATDPVIWGHL